MRVDGGLERCVAVELVEPTIDEKFIAALEAGLPDCAGVALGVDRLLMLSTGAQRLSDVLPFPAGSA